MSILPSNQPQRPDPWPVTRLSLVYRAIDLGDPRALADICRLYDAPILAFILKWGYQQADAEDLRSLFHIQTEYLLAILFDDRQAREANSQASSPAKPQLRRFIQAALRNFLLHAYQEKKALKRSHIVLLDDLSEAQRYRAEPADLDSADIAYQRAWLVTLLSNADAQIEAEHNARQPRHRYKVLREYVNRQADDDATITALAEQLGERRDTLNKLIRSLILRLRDIIRQHVGDTLMTNDPAEIDAELAALMRYVEPTSNQAALAAVGRVPANTDPDKADSTPAQD